MPADQGGGTSANGIARSVATEPLWSTDNGANRRTTRNAIASGFAAGDALHRLTATTASIAGSKPGTSYALTMSDGNSPHLTAKTRRVPGTLRQWACRRLVSLWYGANKAWMCGLIPWKSVACHPCPGLGGREPYSALESVRQAGLVNAEGHDTYSHRIVFPLEGNL